MCICRFEPRHKVYWYSAMSAGNTWQLDTLMQLTVDKSLLLREVIKGRADKGGLYTQTARGLQTWLLSQTGGDECTIRAVLSLSDNNPLEHELFRFLLPVFASIRHQREALDAPRWMRWFRPSFRADRDPNLQGAVQRLAKLDDLIATLGGSTRLAALLPAR